MEGGSARRAWEDTEARGEEDWDSRLMAVLVVVGNILLIDMMFGVIGFRDYSSDVWIYVMM